MPDPIDLAMAQVARYEMSVAIAASRARVWDALVVELARWWPQEFYTLPTARMTLEPRVGGRMFEDADGGAGRLWYQVVTFMPPDELELSGFLMPAFGGPGTTLIRITLKEAHGATTVTLADAVVGRLKPDGVGELREGWRTLLEALQLYAEGP